MNPSISHHPSADLPGPRRPHPLGPLAQHYLPTTFPPTLNIPQNPDHTSPLFYPRTTPPRTPPLYLPLRLPPRPLDLRPHNATTNANARTPQLPQLVRWC